MAQMPNGWVVLIENDGKDMWIKETRELVLCRDCLCFHRNVHDRGDDSYCSSINCEVRDYDYCSRAIRRPKEDK